MVFPSIIEIFWNTTIFYLKNGYFYCYFDLIMDNIKYERLLYKDTLLIYKE